MPETKRNIYAELSALLPPEAKQIALDVNTHKGYDTTGQGYQYHVDRFNEVLGIGGWTWDYKVIAEDIDKYTNGKVKYCYVVDVFITVRENSDLGLKEVTQHCAGGHDSRMRADALKGAITNAFKKTAAFFGVGREAYAGELDDDYKPNPDRADGNNGNGNGKPSTPLQPPKDNKKPEPPKSKSEPQNNPLAQKTSSKEQNAMPLKKPSAEVIKRIKGASLYIGEISSAEILNKYKIKNIDSIDSEKTAEEVLKEFVSAYRKAVGV